MNDRQSISVTSSSSLTASINDLTQTPRQASVSITHRPVLEPTPEWSFTIDATGKARGLRRPVVGMSEAPLRQWNIIDEDGHVIDEVMKQFKETLVIKGDLNVTTEEGEVKNRFVVLTREKYYEFKLTNPPPHDQLPDPYAPSSAAYGCVATALRDRERADLDEAAAAGNSIDNLTKNFLSRNKKGKDWLDFHSVRRHPTEENAIVLSFFSGSASKTVAMGLSKMKRFFSSSSSLEASAFADFLKTKTLRCRSPEEALQWLWVTQRLLRDSWQAKFESTICPAPEIYKKHAFVIKKGNERVLVLTNYWMYNVEVSYKPTTIKKVKWAVPVAAVSEVTNIGDGQAAHANISIDEEEAEKLKDEQHHSKEKGGMNKDHLWTFVNAFERSSFVDSLCRVYWEQTRSHLPVLVGQMPTK